VAEPIDLKDHFSSYIADKRGTIKHVAAMLESAVRQMLDALETECQPLRLSR
jgi:hypothetical protein